MDLDVDISIGIENIIQVYTDAEKLGELHLTGNENTAGIVM